MEYVCHSCLRAMRSPPAITTLRAPSRTPLRTLSTASRRISSAHRPASLLTKRAPLPQTTQGSRPLDVRIPLPSRHPHSLRPFSTTSSHPDTKVVQNPRQDEDGTPMTISITPRATRRLLQIAAKDSNPSLALRITVESGGCHGFQYLMSLTDMSKVDEGEDTVFEATDGEGGKGEGAKARVVMDEASLELLRGSTVDYTMELIGSQFKIVGNPRATSSCGCGTSFDVKI